MVRAILEGRKTMTRRVVKPQPTLDHGLVFEGIALGKFGAVSDSVIACPYGTIGDRLWVKETHHVRDAGYVDGTGRDIVYKADDEDFPYGWTPSIHMPRWASRINLEITGIRVERVQDISEEDARAEGLWCKFDGQGCEGQCHKCSATAKEAFEALWDSINSKRAPWASNPWVWVIEFGRAK
jgi:hypothetical protein